MILSKQKENEARKLKCTTAYLVAADLISLGYSEEDAFTIAYPENVGRATHINNSVRKSIFESANFNKLLEERRARIKSGVTAPDKLEDVMLVGTEVVLKEILNSARQQPMGSKERADLFAKYNDIKTKNETGDEEENDNISFVFPLKCNQCPLLVEYNKYVKEHGGQEIKPIEMQRVMAAAKDVIEKSE